MQIKYTWNVILDIRRIEDIIIKRKIKYKINTIEYNTKESSDNLKTQVS